MLISRIGVISQRIRRKVSKVLDETEHRPLGRSQTQLVLLGKEANVVEYRVGDIFAFTEDADALVNTVNCVGVMGRGVALQFKRAFPANFKAYAAACRKKEVRPGRMFLFETRQLTNPRYIINFPTKRHWRGKSRIEDIEAGLDDLTRVIRSHDIRSVVIPPLGSGLGGLNWSEVRPRIESALAPLENLRAIVFEPGGGPTDDRANRSTDVPNMTPGRAALVVLMEKYLRGFLDPFVTLLEVHKLMYFLPAIWRDVAIELREGPSRPVCGEPETCTARH